MGESDRKKGFRRLQMIHRALCLKHTEAYTLSLCQSHKAFRVTTWCNVNGFETLKLKYKRYHHSLIPTWCLYHSTTIDLAHMHQRLKIVSLTLTRLGKHDCNTPYIVNIDHIVTFKHTLVNRRAAERRQVFSVHISSNNEQTCTTKSRRRHIKTHCYIYCWYNSKAHLCGSILLWYCC